MEGKNLQWIQDQIGYRFQNLDLLQQAFVRRSYAKENGGEDNEVLEFIGDKALDITIVKLLAEKFGYYASECDGYDADRDFDEFCCAYSEGDLTEIKQQLVQKKSLAHRIELLGFADYLIMGKGDIQNHVENGDSVKEDLFEAIIGAVALDSKWDFAEIQSVVELMLDPDSYLDEKHDNDVELLQEWALKRNGAMPLYHFEKADRQAMRHSSFKGISQSFSSPGSPREAALYACLLKLTDALPVFRGFGSSKSKARQAVCKLAYHYLEKHNLLVSIRDEIKNPNKAEAINQLETLSRRGYFSLPAYHFEQEYDENGDPVWTCECQIEEYDTVFWAKSSTKRNAKKIAAFHMLEYVLNEGE